jgi:Transposase DDE domain
LVISPSDPSSAWTAKANKRVLFGYGLNYLIDVEHAIIVDVEATPARTYDEVGATRTMLERTRQRLKLSPRRLAADTAYGTGKFLAFITGAGIVPHIPVWDKSRGDDGTFSRSEFRFDRRRNVYICPAGETLTTSGRVHSDHAIRYFASVPRCRECPLKQRCRPNTPARRIVRDLNEAARDIARRKMKTKAFFKSRDQRKRVEMRFADVTTGQPLPQSPVCTEN